MSPSSGASKGSSANSSPAQGFFLWFDERLVPPLKRFGETPAMRAVREALPLSFAGLLVGVPLFMLQEPKGTFLARFLAAFPPSFSVMAVFLVVVLAVRLAKHLRLPWFAVAFPALTVFVLSLPREYNGLLSFALRVGSSGLFLAIVVALLAGFVGWIAQRYSPAPWLMAGALAAFVGVGFLFFALHLSLADGLAVLLRPLAALGDTYVALLLITIVETLLWTAGIHGPALLAAIVTPVYLALQAQNTLAFQHGSPLPHTVVVSIFLFVFPGGAGATLPLVLLLGVSRIRRLRKLARLVLVPSIFNANEPLLFGLPLVFNPFLSLPFVVAPAVLATITYCAMTLGFVHRAAVYVPSTIPTVVSTYLATFDWRAVVLVVFNVIVAGAIYFPFVRAYERHEPA